MKNVCEPLLRVLPQPPDRPVRGRGLRGRRGPRPRRPRPPDQAGGQQHCKQCCCE